MDTTIPPQNGEDVCLSICLSVRPSVCPSVRLPTHNNRRISEAYVSQRKKYGFAKKTESEETQTVLIKLSKL